jgi:hypothetical protein
MFIFYCRSKKVALKIMHIFAAISRIKVKQLLSSYYFHSIRLIKKQTSLVFSWLWEFEATEL